ncbi:cytochrome P450 [Streptomyces sp. DEF1AK]|uniref:cytochrome P450 n=1 Tax=Streptomyces sp. DEF1AK TaxID=2759677 RepID=UPI001916B87D|nr:cytochrome P450 [Streptomyces sp. DEF1AK]MBK3391141.1 cytochrome P450 [Streptomyces sp. DEF1AK]
MTPPDTPAATTDAPAAAAPAAPATGGCPVAHGTGGAEPAPLLLGGDRFQSDPIGLYRDLRRDHGPVAPVVLPGKLPAWLVIGYRELHQVTSDPVLYSRDSDLWNQWDRVPENWPLLPMIGKQESILYTVGERHRRRAAVMEGGLEAVEAHELRATTERLADSLIDDFCGSGEADVIADYAMMLPALVLFQLFGLPESEGRGLAHAINDMINGGERALAGQQHIRECVGRMVADLHVHPRDHVTSRMLRLGGHLPGEDRAVITDEFSAAEIIQDVLVMVVAGHQPTADWIGNTLRLMLTDTRFAASLFGGRHSIAEAMNEVLWEDTPSQNIAGRWATRDTHIGGRRIREGDLLILSFAGANYDPLVRTDQSALTGGNNAFFSFGHGEHRCPFPAREIAEIVARTAIEVILDRLPDIDLAVAAEELTRRPSPWLRGLTRLPVRFTPVPAG